MNIDKKLLKMLIKRQKKLSLKGEENVSVHI